MWVLMVEKQWFGINVFCLCWVKVCEHPLRSCSMHVRGKHLADLVGTAVSQRATLWRLYVSVLKGVA